MSANTTTDDTAKSEGHIGLYLAMGCAVLLLATLALWLAFGGDVFARMGAAAWALCF
jgi:hypothetical protein